MIVDGMQGMHMVACPGRSCHEQLHISVVKKSGALQAVRWPTTVLARYGIGSR